MHIQYHITNLIDCKMYVIIRFSIGFQVISLFWLSYFADKPNSITGQHNSITVMKMRRNS